MKLFLLILVLLSLSACSSTIYVENCENVQGNLYKCEKR